jgi:formylglycine-generating enzyme required for sulfatase activity
VLPLLVLLATTAGADADDALEVVLVTGRAHCDSIARLRLEADETIDPEVATTRWEASAGLLLYDDLVEVEWRPPKAPGRVRITVALSTSRGVVKKGLDVDVRHASTEGMVWIPPGPFIRGDVEGTHDTDEIKTLQNSSDEPYHHVELDGYWVDRYPVTNRKYKAFLDTVLALDLARVTDVAVFGEFEGSSVPFYYFRPYEELILDYYETRNARRPTFRHVLSWDGEQVQIQSGQEDHPVVDVSWFGSAAYARFYGKELPSEAEWEKAARGTDGRAHPWGDTLPSSYHVNLEGVFGDGLTPVGFFSPQGDSPYGVADIFSGCFEWTADWFNAEYYDDHRATTPLRNPRGPFWGTAHVIRGFPGALHYRTSTIDRLEAVSFRYQWEFEFLLGDSFANGETTFRTVSRQPRTTAVLHLDPGAGTDARAPERARR